MIRPRLSARILIFDRDDYTCYLCGKRKTANELHVDHVYPHSKGGSTSLKNLRTACKKCNLEKRDKEDFQQIVDYILDDPDGEFIWLSPELKKFDIRFVIAAIKLILLGQLKVKKGKPS